MQKGYSWQLMGRKQSQQQQKHRSKLQRHEENFTSRRPKSLGTGYPRTPIAITNSDAI
jgi:hypothetical protein